MGNVCTMDGEKIDHRRRDERQERLKKNIEVNIEKLTTLNLIPQKFSSPIKNQKNST